MTRLLITGSRHGWDHEELYAALLDARLELGKYPTLVHGAADGVDVQAARIWAGWGLPVEAHPADWDTYKTRAGPMRNKEMVNLGADLCLGFVAPGSKGTVHTVKLAKRADIPTKIYERGTVRP